MRQSTASEAVPIIETSDETAGHRRITLKDGDVVFDGYRHSSRRPSTP
jgi:hypothetical protein